MKQNLKIMEITINVYNVEKMKAFYSGVLKLAILTETAEEIVYGFTKNSKPVIRLVQKSENISGQVSTGMYHFAILFEKSAELASLFYSLLENNYPLEGAADHLVSEAIYLRDPEGNDIEIYWDRPQELWTWENNQVKMATLELGVEALLSQAQPWFGFSEQVSLGHLHFYANDILAADTFFVNILGTEIVSTFGAAAHFYSINKYHHHFAANIWKGTDLLPRVSQMLGVNEWKIAVDEAYFETIMQKADKLGYDYELVGDSIMMFDPMGLRLSICKLN